MNYSMKLHVNSICTFVVLAASLSFLMSVSSSISVAIAPAVIVGPPAPVAISVSNVKSYREWKISMVSEAEARLKTTRNNILLNTRTSASKDSHIALNAGTEGGLGSELQAMHDRYDKESFQLSMVRDLTISDYFVGYLTKQSQLEKAIREVSGRLSAEEVAELMSAYANNFFSSKPSGPKQSSQADASAVTSP